MKSQKVFLRVILDSVNRVIEYTQWLDFESFIEDYKTFDATLMQLQHLWETTKNMVDVFWNIKDLPTSEMISMRNFIAHDYLWVSKKIIYDVVVNELPKIKEKINDLLKII